MIESKAKAFQAAYEKFEIISKRRVAAEAEANQLIRQEDQARMEMTRLQRELIEGAKALPKT
ncbi:hypothetical protein HYP85_gp079 [Pseudomonas phage Zuri]|uniref:Uncharacterized protein n=1 Tax=Pseudomonas phage Zuri TaxID=2604899 RepID=A0A5C1K5K1_9CAUD|nr:hypothetical protein HYP85_gp079 [Pseudomonas phage Zuri]QEM41088.1 hypothetical protein Zuri_94 [Pseudomonas phage Zuri]